MKKYLLIIAIIFLFIVSIILFLITGLKQNRETSTLPTPTLAQLPTTAIIEDLLITNTEPTNNASGIGIDQGIIISFNRIFNLDEIMLINLPSFKYAESIQSKTLIIKPEKLIPQTQYEIIITSKKSGEKLIDFKFTTASENFYPLPINIQQADEQWEKENRPDMFLYKKVPYSQNLFSVTSSFRSSPTGHFAFTVSSKTNAANVVKNAFLSWLSSLGLTDQEIQKLDITYQ